MPFRFIRLKSLCQWLTLAVACGCGSEVPTPRYVPQPASALMQVHAAPPPARVESIPAQPARGAVWIDGEWAWQGRKWAWRRGRWVMAPTGASYSPWTMTRDQAGNVWFAPGVFRNARGEPLAEPDSLATATTGRSDVTDVNGDKEDTGTLRTRRRDGGAPRSDAGTSADDSMDGGAP